jgi:predicted transcriptional regulator
MVAKIDATVAKTFRGVVMNTVKEAVIRMIQALPDDCTMEDIAYHVAVRRQVEQGMADVAAGRVISQEEAERRTDEWLRSYGWKGRARK